MSTPPPQSRRRIVYPILTRTPEEVAAHLRAAYAELGEPFTVARYRRWRADRVEATGEPRPSVEQLQKRFGSFTEACQFAMPLLFRDGRRLAGAARVAACGEIAAAAAPAASAAESPVAPPTGQADDGRTETGTLGPVDPGADAVEPTSADAPRDEGSRDRDPAVATIAAMLDGLDTLALRELDRALRRLLTGPQPPAAKRRAEQLAFLAQLLDESQEHLLAVPGEGQTSMPVVQRKLYDQLRPPSAPTSERLVRVYGSWIRVCRAAHSVKADGRKAAPGPVSVPARPLRQRGSLTREEVAGAVAACAKAIGRRPSSADYHCWLIERRARARQQGQRVVLPDYAMIVRTYRRLLPAECAKARSVWQVVMRDAREAVGETLRTAEA